MYDNPVTATCATVLITLVAGAFAVVLMSQGYVDVQHENTLILAKNSVSGHLFGYSYYFTLEENNTRTVVQVDQETYFMYAVGDLYSYTTCEPVAGSSLLERIVIRGNGTDAT